MDLESSHEHLGDPDAFAVDLAFAFSEKVLGLGAFVRSCRARVDKARATVNAGGGSREGRVEG